MTATKKPPRDSQRLELWSLLCAIASDDDKIVRRMLEASPTLALEISDVGASRETAASYFLETIGHYVYSGDTALHIAAAAHRADIARELVARGANTSAKNRRGAEPLHYAAVGSPGSARWNPGAQAAVIEFLIHAGASPNAVNKNGVTPLHVAIRTRCAGAVRALLAHGADPARKNGNGSTPMRLAEQNTGRGGSGSAVARAEQAEIVQLLADRGVRLT